MWEPFTAQYSVEPPFPQSISQFSPASLPFLFPPTKPSKPLELPAATTWFTTFFGTPGSSASNGGMDSFLRDLKAKELVRIRQRALKPERGKEGLASMLGYVNQLEYMARAMEKAPPGAHVLAAVPKFSWGEVFRSKQASFQDLAMEQACVLFNFASILAQIASLQDKSVGGLKISAAYFQRAAGVYIHIRDSLAARFVKPVGTNCDLSEHTLTALAALMLAQAYECVYEYILIGKAISQTASQVAYHASEYYKIAVERMPVKTRYHSTFYLPEKWVTIGKFKALLFLSLAHYYCPPPELPEGALGTRIRRLDVAKSPLEHIRKLAKDLPKEMSRYAMERYAKLLSESLAHVMKLNEQVYHELLPTEALLAPLRCPQQPLVLVTEFADTQLQFHSPMPNITDGLLPTTVVDHLKAHKGELDKEVSPELREFEVVSDELLRQISEWTQQKARVPIPGALKERLQAFPAREFSQAAFSAALTDLETAEHQTSDLLLQCMATLASTEAGRGEVLSEFRSLVFEFQNQQTQARRRIKSLASMVSEASGIFKDRLTTERGIEEQLSVIMMVDNTPRELEGEVARIQGEADKLSLECDHLKRELAEELAPVAPLETFDQTDEALDRKMEKKRSRVRELKAQLAQKTAEQKQLLRAITALHEKRRFREEQDRMTQESLAILEAIGARLDGLLSLQKELAGERSTQLQQLALAGDLHRKVSEAAEKLARAPPSPAPESPLSPLSPASPLSPLPLPLVTSNTPSLSSKGSTPKPLRGPPATVSSSSSSKVNKAQTPVRPITTLRHPSTASPSPSATTTRRLATASAKGSGNPASSPGASLDRQQVSLRLNPPRVVYHPSPTPATRIQRAVSRPSPTPTPGIHREEAEAGIQEWQPESAAQSVRRKVQFGEVRRRGNGVGSDGEDTEDVMALLRQENERIMREFMESLQ